MRLSLEDITLPERIIQFLVHRSQKQYSPWELTFSILSGATAEVIAVPAILIVIGKRLDAIFGLGNLLPSRAALFVACTFFLVGIPWLGGSIFWHHRYGKGTPLPLVPTKALLNSGPYAYTRNPMLFGAIFWLAGWACAANSPTAFIGGVGCFAALISSYEKLIEEHELERRFGDAYRIYKNRVPFLIPRFNTRKEKLPRAK